MDLVGAGAYPKEVSVRNEADFIPNGTQWLQDAVVEFDPEHNTVYTRNSRANRYAFLVVAPGIQIDWDQVKGLKETIGRNGVCSNYAYEHVDSTWEVIRNFKGGNALFTAPATAIKCGGAPQKIMYLAESCFRMSGVRNDTEGGGFGGNDGFRCAEIQTGAGTGRPPSGYRNSFSS